MLITFSGPIPRLLLRHLLVFDMPSRMYRLLYWRVVFILVICYMLEDRLRMPALSC
jgi:hypothetical protein